MLNYVCGYHCLAYAVYVCCEFKKQAAVSMPVGGLMKAGLSASEASSLNEHAFELDSWWFSH